MTTDFKNLYMILGELLNSAALDRDTQAKDCMEVFGEYEWTMTPDCDETLFQELLEKGNNGTMTIDELDDFMDMVSRDGQAHVYFSIYQGIKAIAAYAEPTIQGISKFDLPPWMNQKTKDVLAWALKSCYP